MIGQATAHRRANAFAQALEAAVVEGESPRTSAGPLETTGEHGAHAADRHADTAQGHLVALAHALGELPKPAMGAEAKTVQRAQLIAAMENALADGSFEVSERVPEQRDGRGAHRATGISKLKPRSRWSRRLAAGGLSVGVAAGAFGGVAAASTNALPGDTLYGLKRGMEDLKLNMADNDASRGKVYLDMASTRLQEARRLMERGRSGELDAESVSEVRRALSGMHQEATEGHRLLSQAYRRDGSLQPMEALNAFSATHRQGWSELRDRLPSQLTDVSNQVSSVFDAIDQEVAPLQSQLPKPSGGDGSAQRRPGKHLGTGSGGSTPSTAASGSRSAGPGHGTASPSDSAHAKDGLLGGADSLLNPPTGSGTPTPTKGESQPSVTLPPLFPGLLPGLGLGSEDTKE